MRIYSDLVPHPIKHPFARGFILGCFIAISILICVAAFFNLQEKYLVGFIFSAWFFLIALLPLARLHGPVIAVAELIEMSNSLYTKRFKINLVEFVVSYMMMIFGGVASLLFIWLIQGTR
jgi:hypothetical protein